MAKRKSKDIAPKAEVYKPSLFIDSKTLRGKSLKVGKKVKVEVSGLITEESLRNYEAEGRRSYKLEIQKVKVPSRKK